MRVQAANWHVPLPLQRPAATPVAGEASGRGRAPVPPGVDTLRSLQERGFGLWEDRGVEVVTFTRVEVPLTPTEFARALELGRNGLALGRDERRIPVANLEQVEEVAALHGLSRARPAYPEAGLRLKRLAGSGWKLREAGAFRSWLTFEEGYQRLAGGQPLGLTGPDGRELGIATPQEAVEADYFYGSGDETGLDDLRLARAVRQAVPPDQQLEALRLMKQGPAAPVEFGAVCRALKEDAAGVYRRLCQGGYAGAQLGSALGLVSSSAGEFRALVDYLAGIPSLPGARGRRLAALERLLPAGATVPEATRAAELADIRVDGTDHLGRLEILEALRRGGSEDLASDYEALLKYRDQELVASAREYVALLAGLAALGRADGLAAVYARLQEGGQPRATERFLSALAVSGSIEQALLDVELGDTGGRVVPGEDAVLVGSVRLPRRRCVTVRDPAAGSGPPAPPLASDPTTRL